jgi:hypothetical protein
MVRGHVAVGITRQQAQQDMVTFLDVVDRAAPRDDDPR